MNAYILSFQETDITKLALVGGKGANLGELSNIEGIKVPEGFCITTEVYKKVIKNSGAFNSLMDQLIMLKTGDRTGIIEISTEIRKVIEEIKIPKNIEHDINRHLEKLGVESAYAVRSSATAEDLPTASFAGQQDTYLNIIGKEAILKHISKCWASLFTERAIIYRLQNGFDHRKVYLSVVIQKMIFSDVAGILFTADPVTSNRKILSIDASFGLGEALVSGLVNADNYKVRDGKIIDKKVSSKKMAVVALKGGGTNQQDIDHKNQNRQALTDEQIIHLAYIGRKIESHFGQPQDIEWCLKEDTFYIVQSRPITTLFPIPDAGDEENHVYLSVGHQQMMTDAMKPLGLSVWQLNTGRPMFKAGGRLFVDVSHELSLPAKRHVIVDVLGKFDPLIKEALATILEREDFIKTIPEEDIEKQDAGKAHKPLPDYQALNDYDTSIVDDLILHSEASIAKLKQDIQDKSGTDLIDFIHENILQLRQWVTDTKSFGVIMSAMNASSWINEKMYEWLSEKNTADIISQSVPDNITSEMGLALLDVADVIRPHQQVIAYLHQTKNNYFLDELDQFAGGKESHEAINAFLDKYGMRCAGEIDITKPRWSEKPLTLVPVILSHIKNFKEGESKRKFEKGLREALKKEHELIDRLKNPDSYPGPDGAQKAKETKRMIDLVRNLAGYREYPKYSIVKRNFVYKQALLKEAEQLVKAGVLQKKEDIYFLTLEELREAIRTQKMDVTVINTRKEEFKIYEKLNPPRVITSDGEIITGKYKKENLPAGAIAGLAVSSGVIEGRARVIVNMEDAEIEEGDILVTIFTDPSWTPLFVSIKGLVTEVGGLMTHGAVIAREYGLPAVVGVENATQIIKNGQRIRVNGTDGYVEIL